MLAYCVLLIEKACTEPSLVRRLSAYTSRTWCSIVVRQGCVGVVLLPWFYERTILPQEHCASSATPCQLPNVPVARWRCSSLAVHLAKTVHKYCGLGFGIFIDLEMGLYIKYSKIYTIKIQLIFFYNIPPGLCEAGGRPPWCTER